MTKTTTRRQAKVTLNAVAEADWDETIDIPDDVRPDDVDEWIAEQFKSWGEFEVRKAGGWDYCDVNVGTTTISGTWQPEEGTEEYGAWLEAERLRPMPGQTDIFGGVVGAAPEGAA